MLVTDGTHSYTTGHQQQPEHLPPSLASGQTYQTTVKYEPELNRALNPHYYDANKLLFEAHMYKLYRAQER